VADVTGAAGSGGTADAHAEHDPEVVASLLDGDLVEADRAAAARQVASCPACAALHRDLIALANATRELPTPLRTSDFRLTAADSERLREPMAASARLTGDMQTTASHASHDTLLVASLVDHGVVAPERDAAERLIAACGLCAALHDDLVALSAATRTMPTPARPRDYTLTAEDAVRLRPRGWRRLIGTFGTSRDAFSRPLAVGLTTLGLAGLLVATVPSVLPGGSATSRSTVGAAVGNSSGEASNAPGGPLDVSGSAPEAGSGGRAPGADAAAPSGDFAGPVLAPSRAPVGVGSSQPGAADQALRQSAAPGQGDAAGGSSKGTGAASGEPTDASASPAGRTLGQNASGIPALIVASGALLIVGLGLFLIRWAARRRADR
jgi:anti-sigma factor RsiW